MAKLTGLSSLSWLQDGSTEFVIFMEKNMNVAIASIEYFGPLVPNTHI